jgi:hypothetical protein
MKRILIWLKRYRYRCGYGVHSPFAFDFITNVIYEKTPYYAYRELEKGKRAGHVGEKESSRSRKVNRLLFRLVNWAQPPVIMDGGGSQTTSGYLRAAKKGAGYIALASADTVGLLQERTVDFLYIDRPEDPAFMERLFEYGAGRVGGRRMMIVIRDIYRSAATKAFWKRVTADERVGVTFDLYDLGILFFDTSKIKQHYTVNF